MAVNIPKPLVDLLNKTDPGYHVLCHMVPTRIIRVIVDSTFRTFRVEQLVRTNRDNLDPKGTWRTLSTHGGETPGLSYDPAMRAAIQEQKKLREKLNAKIGKARKLIRP